MARRFLRLTGLAMVAIGCAREPDRVLAVAGDMAVLEAFAPQPVAPDAAALYFTVANRGGSADRLLAVMVDVADSASVHESVSGGGTMRMVPRDDIRIAAGDTLTMRPGGLHTMLTGALRTYVIGDSVSVTIRFERAGVVRFWAEVISYADAAARAETHADHESQ